MIRPTNIILLPILFLSCIQFNTAATTRTVDLLYRAEMTEIPDTAERIALWLPLPANHENQTIKNLRLSASHDYNVLIDEVFKNRFLYIEIEVAGEETLEALKKDKPWLQITATITRRSYNRLESKFTMHNPRGDLAQFLKPSSLIPIDGTISSEAISIIGDETDPLKQTHLIYKNIVDTVKYDKTGDGWGRGDAVYACNIRTGNCTDFHSLFIGEARSITVPARFIMGFPLPQHTTEGSIEGYHCWAEFFTQSNGWVPIDASEAHKHPGKRDEFFGGLDEHRIEFTVGRDILLPKSVSGAINYSIFPQLEVDGKVLNNLDATITFRDWESQ